MSIIYSQGVLHVFFCFFYQYLIFIAYFLLDLYLFHFICIIGGILFIFNLLNLFN
jgi:hypothetical protein